MKKQRIKSQLMLISFALLCVYARKIEYPKHTVQPVDKILTRHKWCLAQDVITKGDSAIDMTLTILPCEKDNYTIYNKPDIEGRSANYQLIDQGVRCSYNSDSVTATGEWSYNEQQTEINERYQGGAWVSKRILAITDETLVLEFEFEGGQIRKQVYLSETGITNTKNQPLLQDNTDPAVIIRKQIIKLLSSSTHHTLLEEDSAESLEQHKAADNDPLPKVYIASFLNSSHGKMGISYSAWSDSVKQNPATLNADYTILGDVIQCDVTKDKNGFEASLKLRLTVFDTKNKKENSFICDFKEKTEKKIKKGWLMRQIEKAKKYIEPAAKTLTAYGQMKYNFDLSYNYYYPSGLALERAMKAIPTEQTKVTQARKVYYDSVTCILQKFQNLSDETITFISNNMPLYISINKIEHSRKDAILLIEGGHKIGLKKDELLNIFQIERIIKLDGTTEVTYKNIGKIRVNEIRSGSLAFCEIDTGRKEILKIWESNPKDLIVGTMLNE